MADEAAFSQADKLNLSRYDQALSELEKQVDEGTLFPEEAAQLRQQVLLMRAPILERQKKAEQEDQQKQQQDAMHQSAMTESMDQQNVLSRAQAFPQTVTVFKNPSTGEEAYFYQSKGGWEQIKFEGGGPAVPGPPAQGE